MKRPTKDRVGDFMAGKGFYIVLFLCVAAIGISGYYLFTGMTGAPDNADTAVGGTAHVIVSPTARPTVEPVKPTITAAPRPTQKPMAQPKPTAPATPTITAAAPVAPVTTSAVFTWPVKGEVIGAFSVDTLVFDETMGDWRTHDGIDIAAAQGAQVLAAAGGTVTVLRQDDLMGTLLLIDHGNGVVSTYSNLAAVPTVAVGDVVSTGDVIGSVGATALAESALPAHLHLALTQDGLPVDPLAFLPARY